MVTMETKTDVKPKQPMMENGPYLEKFEQFEKGAKDPAWVRVARKAGISHFVELGFPTLRDEDWRFTNVAPIAKLPFEPVIEPTRDAVAAKALNQFTFAGLSGSRIVFVNGHFAPELSSVAKLPDGVKVMSLAAALASDTALVEKHLFRHARADTNAFTALNTAFFQDGAFIYVPAGKTVPEPIQLLYVSTAKENGAAAHVRTLIVAEPGSHATVIENFVSLSDASYVTNSVTELVAGENDGLYLTRGEQLADHYMIIEHVQPHCASHEYFNGILADKSKGVFHGRILVRPGAQKTDAKQTNKNLLLSDDATANTKPQLEIYADDVKCTHGATIGQLNDESIFYMRARGIALEKARRILIHAFAGEIIDRVRCEPLREELDKVVWDRLEQNEQVAVNQ